MEITDTELAVIREGFGAIANIFESKASTPSATSAGPVSVAGPAAAGVVDPTSELQAAAAGVSSSSGVASKGDVVKQQTTTGWLHTEAARYGIVTRVDDVAQIVGVDNSDPANPVDVAKVHADVAWFGNDGLTTVALDELTIV